MTQRVALLALARRISISGNMLHSICISPRHWTAQACIRFIQKTQQHAAQAKTPPFPAGFSQEERAEQAR